MTKLKILDKSVFRRWFDGLDAHAAAKVITALYRLEEGDFSNVKPVVRAFQSIKLILEASIVFILDRTVRSLLFC